MYLQITTKCNMSCAHCGYACTNKGQHMSLGVVKKALKLFGGESISIGGGEPTLHPKFWEILGLALGSCSYDDGYVWMATNGSITDTALALANMARKGILGVELSQDEFHDEIDSEVVKAFTKKDNYDRTTPDARAIRNTSHRLINAGRCDWGEVGCVCPSITVKPDGSIKGCGCKDATDLGTVSNPKIPDEWQHGECSRDQEEESSDQD